MTTTPERESTLDWEEENAQKIFSRRLADAVRRLNLTNSQAAKLCGVAAATFSSYVKGKSVPDVLRLGTVCHALGVTPDELLGFANDEQLTPSDRELGMLRLFRQLDERGKQICESLILDQLGFLQTTLDPRPPADNRRSPRICAGNNASHGSSQINSDLTVYGSSEISVEQDSDMEASFPVEPEQDAPIPDVRGFSAGRSEWEN